MAILGSFTKQPREVLDCDIDYATVLAGRNDILLSHSVEVFPSGELTIVSSTIYNNKLKIIVSGGTDKKLYKLTVLMTTSANLVYEDEINVIIKEV